MERVAAAERSGVFIRTEYNPMLLLQSHTRIYSLEDGEIECRSVRVVHLDDVVIVVSHLADFSGEDAGVLRSVPQDRGC